MSDRSAESSDPSSQIDTESLRQALATAKLHIDTAVQNLESGETPSAATLTALRRALSDQNTGCQNSGCGGSAAETAARLAQVSRPGQG